MRCPSCSHDISDAEYQCSVCDFEIDQLDDLAAEAGLEARAPAGDIHDPSGRLGRTGAARVQDRIDAFEDAAGAEMRVVVVDSVKPLQASEAAFWLFNRWQMGGPENEGVLLVFALADRKVACEVGFGLEAHLSDDEAGRVLDFHVVPLLRQRALEEAVYHAVHLVATLVEAARRPPVDQEEAA